MSYVRIAGIYLSVVCGVAAGAAVAQNFPNKPIRLITTASGGGSDFSTRMLAAAMSESMGQNVIVENRGGGSVKGNLLAKAIPDGYSLLHNGSSLWISGLMREVDYTMAEFAPITVTISAPNVMVVHPSFPAKTVKEVIAIAKAKPGMLNYGSASIGTSNHLAAELFKSMAGIDLVRVPHKGSGPALLSLLGNQVQLMISSAGSVAPYLKSEKLRAIAITSPQRSPQYPELPTIAASGLPGYEFMSIWGVFAPAKTPKPIVAKLNQEFVRALTKPEIKDKYLAAGIDVVASSPEQLAAAIKADVVRLGKVIKDAGIREE